MRKISASLLFDGIHKPTEQKIILLSDNGTIEDIIEISDTNPEHSDIEFYDGIICPGFINTHCHLELSWMKGNIPEHTGLDEFIRKMAAPGERKEDLIREKIVLAEELMARNGIVAVGDIMNTTLTIEAKTKQKLWYHNFIEVFGSDPEKTESQWNHWFRVYESAVKSLLSASLTPHSPYSLSVPLFRKLSEMAIRMEMPMSIHMMENDDENEYFLQGKGKIHQRLQDWGIKTDQEKNPNPGRSVQSIASYLPKSLKWMFVHNTVMKSGDIEFIRQNFDDPWWCFCPNANLYIENKLPDIPIFMGESEKITLGTDSLASNHDLSILKEISTITENFRNIPIHEIFRWGTFNGARFLGISDKFGSIEKGKQPGLNLITHINKQPPYLTPESKVQVITSCHPSPL